ncbi:MAG: protein kinase [Planctomycetaceae bacterium]
MNKDSLSASSENFFQIAEELVMLTKDEVLIIAEAMSKSGLPPEQVAQQKGFLNATQVDIIETLLNPMDTVPGYEIIDLLGQGGMGVVYRARQINLNRIVALKTILISRMADRSTAGRFAKEAQTIGKLRHPNIIAAYDFGQHEGRLFLSMELVEGEDVDLLLQDRGQLDELTAWSIARQTAAGLAHANRLGVVHRDIKPANLLLVDPPEGFKLPRDMQMVKVADFGLAFLADDQQVHTRLTSDNSAVGSPHYMAPEQLTDLDVDFRADMYALGATVYHMLAGRPPFGGLNLSQVIAQKLSGEFKTLGERCPDVSTESCQLVHRMLSREPSGRHADYDSLLKDIDELIQSIDRSGSEDPKKRSQSDHAMKTGVISTHDTQSMPSPDLATDKSPRPRRQAALRDRRRLWFVGAAVLVLGVGMASWLFRDRSTTVPVPQLVDMSQTGWTTPLFSGTSLTGWRIRLGNWAPGRDNEDGFVLEGSNGIVGRPLFKPGDEGKSVPVPYYRLETTVEPHQASGVECHFGLLPVNDFDGPRYVVRIDPEEITLGMRPSDQEAFVQHGEGFPLTREYDSRHVIKIERQPGAWIVTVDGQVLRVLPSMSEDLVRADQDKPVQSFPPDPLPEFRLKVEGGPAWFSDIFIEELSPEASQH